MPSYQVTRTPGGGYWVRQGDSVDLAAGAVGAVAGKALGMGINAVRGHRARVNFRRHDEAIDAMERAGTNEDWDALGELATEFIRYYPNEEDGYIALAGALFRHENINPQIKLHAAQTIASHTSDQTFAGLVRCSAYRDLEDMPRLLQEANQILTSGSADFRDVAFRFRGEALLWLGDLDQALADANSALSIAPKASAYALRGDIQWARGNGEQAIHEYSLATRVDPGYPKWLEMRASALDNVGRSDEAAADRKLAQHMGTWGPTHEIPQSGANVWTAPDFDASPVHALAAGAQVRVVEVLGVWARIDAKNMWTGWVDHRILLPINS